MNEQQAFEAVVQALEGANAGHRFSLKDSATIFAALGVLANALGVATQPEAEEPAEEESKGKKK